jgi:hypothetical protein
MKSKMKIGLLTLCAVLVLSATVHAVSIPLEDSGWAVVISSEFLEGGQVAVPFVYGVTDDAVVIQLDKIFDRPFQQDGFNYPIIIHFWKLSADATPKIIIEDECIENETGTEWTDYHMHLMVNPLAPEAGFDPAFIPDGDQLEDVSYSSNYGYSNLPIDLDFVDSDGSGVLSSPPVEPGENWFRPGYWNGDGGRIVIVTNPQMEVSDHFGLKEVPTTVPEPATIVLFGTAGVWIFNRTKQQFFGGFRRK